MRSITNLFAESPFKPLEEHALVVKQCNDLLKECMEKYCNEEFEEAEKLALKIAKLEREADDIKTHIREHLPRSMLMPVGRGDILSYIKEQDQVADGIKAVVFTLALRRTTMPLTFKKDLQELTKKVADVVDLVPLVVKSMNDLLDRSFMRKKETRVEEYINLLGEKEHLTDVLAVKMERYLFEIESKLSYGEFIHLDRVVKRLAETADHAENCGDRMRVMIAKR